VNEVWKESPLKNPDLPRCYVLTVNSPDVFWNENGFNFFPIYIPTTKLNEYKIRRVVGIYQPPTKTVFIVENFDTEQVYRHELQHYFLHLHDSKSQGMGHHQKIWKECEPPRYQRSIKTIVMRMIEENQELKENN